MGGEPYTWRRVSTVRRQAVGNLPPKGGTAPTAEPTPCELQETRNSQQDFVKVGRKPLKGRVKTLEK